MNLQKFTRLGLYLVVLAAIASLSGCATTGGATDPTDPFENANRKFYQVNDSLDKNIIRPIAQGYANVTPEPIRDSVTNFFDNMGELNIVANDLLQGKFLQGLSDASRFVVNSTLGLGGLFDVATDMGLEAHDEDLGQTFGKWGMGEGAYLVIPFLGPDSIRDVGDRVTSPFLSPLFYVTSTITAPLSVLSIVNSRANLLDASRMLERSALDPYTFTREAIRQRREYLIHDGNPPIAGIEEYIDDDEFGFGDDEPAAPRQGPPPQDPGVLKVF